jgi:hypothetical protein
VAFKEWAGVCEALVQGRQSIIVRKGGIREGPGPGVFVPEHAEFWLYPTGVHQAQQGLRLAELVRPLQPAGPDESLPIRALVRVERVGYVRDEATLPALEEFHVFTEETIRKRFHYRAPGLWVLVARIWRREPAFTIMATPEQAGCKTWVTLDPALPTSGLVPVLDDAAWAGRLTRLQSVLPSENPYIPASST